MRADVGTGRLRIADASNNSLGSVTSTQEDWAYAYIDITPGSTLEEMRFWLQGDEATADIYWGAAGFWIPESRTLRLPSWMNERAKLKGLSEAVFGPALNEAGTYQASGMQLRRLEENRDFRFIGEEGGAWTQFVELNYEPQNPIFITGMRPHGDVDTLSASTDTTNLNLNKASARSKHLLGKRYAMYASYRDDGLDEVKELERRSRTVSPVQEHNIRAFLSR